MAFKIQAYNSKQLAAYYNVGYKLFLSWLKEIKESRPDLGKQTGRTWNPKQVKIIIEQLDAPE